MIPRKLADYAKFIATRYPVVTITGPRQSGKTTLAREVFADKAYVNLENPLTREYATDDPVGFLNQFRGGVVLDEIQRAPELLSFIQVRADELTENGFFILTGSQQFELLHSISQSLAGRTALLKLLPFSVEELLPYYPKLGINELLHRGFYPRIYDQDIPPSQALGDYFETYVERDLRQLVNVHNLGLFQKFVRLCAGRVGQILNLHSLANDTGISHSTARQWLTVLEASYIVFLLPPYHANIGKRLIKSPKLYFYDAGLAAWLCGVEEAIHLSSHPLKGHFYENLVVMEFLKYRYNSGKRSNLFFFRDSTGNEVDLLYTVGHQVLPIEIKAGESISADYFKGLRTFAKFFPEHNLGQILVYAGAENQQRSGVEVISVFDVAPTLARMEDA
ncbi:MAG: ATP-binding protein [Proteobacteria bacterium]|nr:ATP-binding protein [Pseudomonadota bacterium]MBU1739518.1 ATP-binding protein [Pseudomonadota bacterium]